MIGQTFGSLKVLSKSSVGKSGNQRYRCKCDCGALEIARGNELRSGRRDRCLDCRLNANANTNDLHRGTR